MKIRKYNEYKEQDPDQGDMENLLYLLRTYFKRSGVDAVVRNKGLDLSIQVHLNSVEKLETLVKIFGIAKKVRKDMLAQYDSEVDMWSYKGGQSGIDFNFYFDQEDGDDNAPF